MTEIAIRPGFPEDQRNTAASLYWEAFGAKLATLLGPAARAEAFFADILHAPFAIGAVRDGHLLGLAGFKTADGALTGGDWPDLRRHYGALGGLWRAPLLAFFERPVEPGVLLMLSLIHI